MTAGGEARVISGRRKRANLPVLYLESVYADGNPMRSAKKVPPRETTRLLETALTPAWLTKTST